ncbi:proline rich mitotic checkpoint control factor L homeolog [Xenopus laevis]|uniref:Papillary renal cell carcinoma protein n=1 Tax=Xenopus laevis TaxID=8355 RepID=Q8QFR3_XENLA|nr:proline rich mitotic checkpoint control factor L homeolog [Xenopus laevis]CAC86901.1 papillary renal cell carcinoma protein [Xenopus laevis]
MSLPPPHGGTAMNLPPPQGGSGMNLPPPQSGSGINMPPPQGGTGLNLPRPQMGAGMNLPPPQSSPGMSLPPPQGGRPQSGTGMNRPSPPSTERMSQPPPPGTSGMSLPPPQGGSGLSYPPPNHGMNLPPSHVSSGLNMPPPQGGHGLNMPPPQLSPTSASGMDHRMPLPPPGYNVNLPPPSIENVANTKPKKRAEPVKITVPELHAAGSDSEEDEPTVKKAVIQGSREGYGLSALLPQPKNADSKRQLLPYSFTKKASNSASDPKHPRSTSVTKPKRSSKPEVSNTPSPSAIKAAAKNAALQVTKQITQEEDEESDEDLQQGNFFSLSDTKETPATISESYPYPVPAVDDAAPPGVEPVELQNDAANAPLDFKTAEGSSDNNQWAVPNAEAYTSQTYSQYPEYADTSASGYYQDYYSSGYYQESDPSSTALKETAAPDSFMDDEAFKRLQGKRNRGREEINFVEIKGDDQLSGNQQWMTKSLTEEKTMKSFSKRKGEQPTGQQRRKHQITYLIHQAKERELELKNSWSENKMSRRQTQAKYGF